MTDGLQVHKSPTSNQEAQVFASLSKLTHGCKTTTSMGAPAVLQTETH